MTPEPPAKPPLWADLLLCFWMLTVGVVYYGGFFFPSLAAFTGAGAALYGVVLLAGAVMLALRFLRQKR